MLKYAYQLGYEQAFKDAGLSLEDFEKDAFLGGLGTTIGKGLAAGAKGLWSGLGTMGRAVGRAGHYMSPGSQMMKTMGPRSAARFGGRAIGRAWKGMSPLERRMLMGAGGAGLYAM